MQTLIELLRGGRRPSLSSKPQASPACAGLAIGAFDEVRYRSIHLVARAIGGRG